VSQETFRPVASWSRASPMVGTSASPLRVFRLPRPARSVFAATSHVARLVSRHVTALTVGWSRPPIVRPHLIELHRRIARGFRNRTIYSECSSSAVDLPTPTSADPTTGMKSRI
jgi:hypothetical protein